MRPPKMRRADDTPDTGAPDRAHDGALIRLIWAIAFTTVVVFVISRLDVFPLSTRVDVNGELVNAPRAFFTVDHPFHIARSQLLVGAWRSLDSLRWIPSHQGGYPAEFFPFGVSGIVAALHIMTFGALAIQSAYTLTVVGLFLLPGLAYWLMIRVDRLSPGIALLAFTGHVAIASTWLQGGYSELVEWGLVTNAAGLLFAVLAAPILTVAVHEGRTRWSMLAVGCISLAVVSNPRSLIAIAVIALALVVRELVHTAHWRSSLVRLSAIGMLTIGACAPVLLPLVRYSDLYSFLHYQGYEGVGAFMSATADTLTLPIALLALAGSVLPHLNTSHRVSQVMSITFVLYWSLTALAIWLPWIQEIVPQLELPRLMPFQRLLMIYLAGYAAVEITRRIAQRVWRPGVDFLLAGLGSMALIVIFATSLSPRVLEERGLRPVPKIEQAAAVELTNMQLAVERADQIAQEHTAILLMGTHLSWHQQLWAPDWSDRRFYYDDWLWFWHGDHDGPSDYRAGHFYPNPSDALSADYLANHGIGAVVVTNAADDLRGGDARTTASASDLLESGGEFGSWQVFEVADPSPLLTLDATSPDNLDVSGNATNINASFEDAPSGSILVRQNWFPRWTATLNGERVEVSRAANGYLKIPTSGGDVEIELIYALTSIDIVARALSLLSMAIVILGLIVGARPIRRWARRSRSADRD
ncbi:hypothetical protein BH20CHL2_BH20CHL2_06600 [soil metagenome]